MNNITKRRVLLIENNREIIFYFKKIFTELKFQDVVFELVIVESGIEGLLSVKNGINNQEPFSIVFIDNSLFPGWNGTETALNIRKNDKDVEIVILFDLSDSPPKTLIHMEFPEKILLLKKTFHSEEIEQIVINLSEKYFLEKSNQYSIEKLAMLFEEIRILRSCLHYEEKEFVEKIFYLLLRIQNCQAGILILHENLKYQLISSEQMTIEETLIALEMNKKDLQSDSFLLKPPFQLYSFTNKIKKIEWIILLKDNLSEHCSNDFLIFMNESCQEIYNNYILQNEYLERLKLSGVGLTTNKIIHDLKNPLAVIYGSADLLKNRYQKNAKLERNSSFLDKILQMKNINDYIAAQINIILEYSRGDFHLVKEKISTKDIIEETLKEYRFFRNEDLLLNIHSYITSHTEFYVDFFKIKRCLVGLLNFLTDSFISSSSSEDVNNVIFTAGIADKEYHFVIYSHGIKIDPVINQGVSSALIKKRKYKFLRYFLSKEIAIAHHGTLELNFFGEDCVIELILPIE